MHRLKGMTVAVVVAASVVAWSGNAFAQAKIVDGPEVRWKLGAWGKPRAATQNVETLRKFLDERTGGRFKIQIGYESFGNPKELLDLLKVGSLEATNICASYHPEKLPVYSALDLPFLPIPDTTVQEKVHNAFHKHPLVLKEFAGWNAIPYMSALLPNNEFVGRGKAPKTVEDFKGMRVRALAGIGEAMRKLGAVPTSVDATEVYTSLERGVVDGIGWVTLALTGLSLQDFLKYRIYPSYWQGDLGMTINLDKWNALSPEARRIIEEEAIRSEAEAHAFFVEEAAKETVKLREAGMQDIVLEGDAARTYLDNAYSSRWREIAEKVGDDTANKLKAMFLK